MTKKNTNIYICCSPNKPLRKSMRRNIPAFFAILILIILILCSACILHHPDKNSTQNAGLAQVSEGSSYISFDLARQNLAEYRPDPANGSSAIKTIYYIHGTNLDISGNALSWIFGVGYAGETGLFAYDHSGWIRIPWNAPPSLKRSMLRRLFLLAVCSARTAQSYSANHPRQILNGGILN